LGSTDVTPHAGVWIEIRRGGRTWDRQTSHPTRVCGLKFLPHPGDVRLPRSHPTRVCGLKSRLAGEALPLPVVTPHAGVWIEI